MRGAHWAHMAVFGCTTKAVDIRLMSPLGKIANIANTIGQHFCSDVASSHVGAPPKLRDAQGPTGGSVQ